jgi:hypothetical protein
MNVKLTIVADLIALLFGVQSASAQEYSQQASAGYSQGTAAVPASLGYGSYNYGGGFYESSVMEGAGALLAGAGSYNLQSAQAIDTLENARAKYIQNYRNAIDAHYAIKRANDIYRAEKFASERPTPEQVSRIIQAKLPDRLTVAEYNRLTGALNWPAALMGPEFEMDRHMLQIAFAQRRPEDVGTTSIFYRDVSQRVDHMYDTMLSKLDDLSTAESIAARRFLKSLEYEARHLPEDTGLAINNR